LQGAGELFLAGSCGPRGGNHLGEQPGCPGDHLGDVFRPRKHDRVAPLLDALKARQDRIVLSVAFIGCKVHDARQGDQVALDGGVRDALLATGLSDFGDQRPIDLVEVLRADERGKLDDRAGVPFDGLGAYLVRNPVLPGFNHFSEGQAGIAVLDGQQSYLEGCATAFCNLRIVRIK